MYYKLGHQASYHIPINKQRLEANQKPGHFFRY